MKKFKKIKKIFQKNKFGKDYFFSNSATKNVIQKAKANQTDISPHMNNNDNSLINIIANDHLLKPTNN